MCRKLLAAVGLAAVALAAFASSAGAANGDGALRTDRRISVTGGVEVAEGEVVNGPVVSVDGPAIINGTVKNVYVGNGRLDIGGPGTGGGHVRTLNIGNLLSGFLIVFLIVLWTAVTVSVGILGLLFVLLFPRA